MGYAEHDQHMVATLPIVGYFTVFLAYCMRWPGQPAPDERLHPKTHVCQCWLTLCTHRCWARQMLSMHLPACNNLAGCCPLREKSCHACMFTHRPTGLDMPSIWDTSKSWHCCSLPGAPLTGT